jgi:hypothetical protein
MTEHLGLDDLTSLAATDLAEPAHDHLAGCELCRDRLVNLRARSADVSFALRGATDAGVGAMPTDVAARITAALATQRTPQPAPQPDAGHRRDTGHRADDLAIARERRSSRIRGWLTAAAVIVVVGLGFGAIQHVLGGQSASTTAGAAGAADSSSGSLAAGATANPKAADGVLLDGSFAVDAKAFVTAKGRPRASATTTLRPSSTPEPLVGGKSAGSKQCATTATTRAAAVAGTKANGTPGSAVVVGPVTVDGRPGVLYLVDLGPVKVAVALAGCSSSRPAVLASATL